MTKRADANDSYAVLLVDATAEEVAQLRKDMPGWFWIEAPKGWPFNFETRATDQSLDAIIVFARRDREAQAFDVCKHTCQEKMMKGVPLLVAASRYQMSLAHEVRRLPRGNFIFTPIDENSLLDAINEIKGAKL
jgi:hypothetical protein